MGKLMRFIPAICILTSMMSGLTCRADAEGANFYQENIGCNLSAIDTLPPADVMNVVTAVISSTNSFNIDVVANLYTPNAVIADDDPPFSWNGPTAGVQWVNAVEKACRDNRLTKLKGTIQAIKVFEQSADNVYIVVPVNFTGRLPGKQRFTAIGAFTFVLRQVDGKWLIKSQVWTQKRAVSGQD